MNSSNEENNKNQTTTQVSAGTIARTIALMFALVNQVLALFNISPLPFETSEIDLAVSTLLTTAASCVAWWKNNSFTNAAIIADNKMIELKKDAK